VELLSPCPVDPAAGGGFGGDGVEVDEPVVTPGVAFEVGQTGMTTHHGQRKWSGSSNRDSPYARRLPTSRLLHVLTENGQRALWFLRAAARLKLAVISILIALGRCSRRSVLIEHCVAASLNRIALCGRTKKLRMNLNSAADRAAVTFLASEASDFSRFRGTYPFHAGFACVGNSAVTHPRRLQ
jgi:hypothetical protein